MATKKGNMFAIFEEEDVEGGTAVQAQKPKQT